MTYQIETADEGWTLADGQGNTIADGDLPLRTPDDIIDGILDDLGIEQPQAEALKVLFKQDWERAE